MISRISPDNTVRIIHLTNHRINRRPTARATCQYPFTSPDTGILPTNRDEWGAAIGRKDAFHVPIYFSLVAVAKASQVTFSTSPLSFPGTATAVAVAASDDLVETWLTPPLRYPAARDWFSRLCARPLMPASASIAARSSSLSSTLPAC